MVYLLHAYFGRDGREEAEELLARHSGDADKPRILGTFNEPITDWLSFFMFTYFTDRDGKYQLKSLAESAFDPLSRTCRFMLTEEAHHMFVGETGLGRVVKRTLEVMKELGTDDPAAVRTPGAVDLPTLQRYLNFWFIVLARPVRLGSLVERRVELRQRPQGPARRVAVRRPSLRRRAFELAQPDRRAASRRNVPMRNAMNEVMRDVVRQGLRDRPEALEPPDRARRHGIAADAAVVALSPRDRRLGRRALRSGRCDHRRERISPARRRVAADRRRPRVRARA